MTEKAPTTMTEDANEGEVKGTQDLPGIWRNRVVRPGSPAGEIDMSPEEIEKLEAMGYLQGTMPAKDLSGVTFHNKTKAQQGLNFYTSGQAPEAHLIDMDGKILHKWARSFFDVWPKHPVPNSNRNPTHWRRAHVSANGDLVGVWDGWGMVKLDKDSKILWGYLDNVHHDLEVLEDGTVYVLEREARQSTQFTPPRPVIDDYVLILDKDGQLLHRVSVLDALGNSEFKSVLRTELFGSSGDILHTNTLTLLDGRASAMNPAFKKGNVLICLRNAQIVCIMDMETEKVVWLTTGMWICPHEPVLLENGNMLIFDNLGLGAGRSRVFEWNPVSKQKTWEYGAGKNEVFYSGILGTVSRLGNGNTLVIESENGRAFELSPEKEIVWEFYVPFTAGENNEFIASLYDVVRLPVGFSQGWADPETEKLTVDLSMFKKKLAGEGQ